MFKFLAVFVRIEPFQRSNERSLIMGRPPSLNLRGVTYIFPGAGTAAGDAVVVGRIANAES
jgi:hypothetical protein